VWIVLIAATMLGVIASEGSRRFDREWFAWWNTGAQDIAIELERTGGAWRVMREATWPDSTTHRGTGMVYIRARRELLSQWLCEHVGVAPFYERWSVECQVTNAERFGNAATAADRNELFAATSSYLAANRAAAPWAIVFLQSRFVYRTHWPGVGFNLLRLAQGLCLMLMAASLLRFLIATRAEMAKLNRCPKCDYSLVGLRDPVCPECGAPVTLAITS